MTANLSDVARRAGVSVATASRALSGRRNVTPELAERVRQVADQLGYRPNAVAQALRRQQTETIGFVVPQISNPFFPAMIEAVERELQATGIDLLLCDAQLDVTVERRRVQTLLSRQVDGLLISPVDVISSAEAVSEACALVPVVQIDRCVDGHPAAWVGLDDAVGIGLVMDHAARRGARTSVFVSGDVDSSSGRRRLDAYRAASHRLGLAQCAPPLLGSFTRHWGRRAGELLAVRALPDVVVCGNDEIAVGVVVAFRNAGRSVPTEVMVTGYDDIPAAELCEPPLTTARQPRARMAVEAVRLLRSGGGSSSDGACTRVSLPPELVVRASTG